MKQLNSLSYLTGFDTEGYGLPGVKRRPVSSGQELIPSKNINQFDIAELKPETMAKQRSVYNTSLVNLWKNNPKKAMAAMATLPLTLLYSGVSSGDDVPESLLNVPRGERFLGSQGADNIWQTAKYDTLKPGGALDWISLFDPTDLSFFGRGPQRYDTNLKTREERKLRDPTWGY